MEKILVFVKEALHLQRDFVLDDNRIDDRYFERQLSDMDKYALEEAVQMGEEDDDLEVVTVTIGPFYAVDTINRALALGADRAIRVWDDGLDEFDATDPLPAATILSTVLEREQPDLVLSGAQSDDASHGATAVLAAQKAGYNWTAVVDEIDREEEAVRVRREVEGGTMETTRVTFPALVTVQSGINEPRYVSLRSLRRQSSDEQIESLDFDDLELEGTTTDSDIRLIGLNQPARSVETTYLDGDSREESSQLIELLESEGVMS